MCLGVHLPYISPISPQYLPYISPRSPLDLPYLLLDLGEECAKGSISPISPQYLPYISPRSPLYLPYLLLDLGEEARVDRVRRRSHLEMPGRYGGGVGEV